MSRWVRWCLLPLGKHSGCYVKEVERAISWVAVISRNKKGLACSWTAVLGAFRNAYSLDSKKETKEKDTNP